MPLFLALPGAKLKEASDKIMGLNQATAVLADPIVTSNARVRLRNLRRKPRILIVDADPIRCERLRDTTSQEQNFEIVAD